MKYAVCFLIDGELDIEVETHEAEDMDTMDAYLHATLEGDYLKRLAGDEYDNTRVYRQHFWDDSTRIVLVTPLL